MVGTRAIAPNGAITGDRGQSSGERLFRPVSHSQATDKPKLKETDS
ncbi:MAG: hypothetical protein AAF685_17975 [Cyanobacteria bacterium P01_C01_bin.89]